MGVDKLFLQIDGKSLLERTIDVCERCFSRVKLVARESARLASLNHEVILDSPMARGPMAGVIAALEDCGQDYCFITAADLPDLSVEIIESLVSQYGQQQYFGFMEPNGLQPLCGIYHRSSLKLLYHHARLREFSVAVAVSNLDHNYIALSASRWRNINCPEDLTVGEPDG